MPSSEGLTAAVEVKAPRFVNLRFKDLAYDARTGQGKLKIFLKEPASVALAAFAVVGGSIGGRAKRSSDLVFTRVVYFYRCVRAGKVNAFSRPPQRKSPLALRRAMPLISPLGFPIVFSIQCSVFSAAHEHRRRLITEH